jgi:hypothetical protein
MSSNWIHSSALPAGARGVDHAVLAARDRRSRRQQAGLGLVAGTLDGGDVVADVDHRDAG